MNRRKKQNQVFYMVLFSIFSAIIILLTLIPNIGYILVPPISITIIHIPVLIGIMVLPFVYSIGLGLVFGLSSLVASFIHGKTPLDLLFQNPLISVLPRVLFAVLAFFVFFGLRKLQKIKNGDTVIFTIVSIITMVFLFFGAYGISSTIHEENILARLNLLLVLAPIFMVIGGLLIGAYYLMLNHKNLKNNIAIPSAVMIGTLIHTILVLIALTLFGDGMGDLIPLLQTVLGSNGFIEIIAALVVATPVSIAIKAAFPERIPQDFFTKERREEIN